MSLYKNEAFVLSISLLEQGVGIQFKHVNILLSQTLLMAKGQTNPF